jgi:hypothetical protein
LNKRQCNSSHLLFRAADNTNAPTLRWTQLKHTDHWIRLKQIHSTQQHYEYYRPTCKLSTTWRYRHILDSLQHSITGLIVYSLHNTTSLLVDSLHNITGLRVVDSLYNITGLLVDSPHNITGLRVQSLHFNTGLRVDSLHSIIGLPVESLHSIIGLPVDSAQHYRPTRGITA